MYLHYLYTNIIFLSRFHHKVPGLEEKKEAKHQDKSAM